MANFQHFSKPNFPLLPVILLSFLILAGLFSLSTLNQIPKPNFIINKITELSQSKKWLDYKLSEAASMIAQNNTLIVCTVSEPFLPLFNNWLISVTRQNHQNKVLVIAEDYQTLFKVNNKWPGHAVLLSPPLESSQIPKDFGSQGFYNLTSRRPQHFLKIMELGYNVMYNDVDTVWLSDPFPYMVENHDIYFGDDKNEVQPLNQSHDFIPNGEIYVCGCLIYMHPTSGSKLVMKKWDEEIKAEPWFKGSNINDQPAFNRALKKSFGQVKMYLLPQAAFPSGSLYFWNKNWVEENKGRQVIIHNNYIVGLKNKIQRFKDFGLWFVDDHISESPIGII